MGGGGLFDHFYAVNPYSTLSRKVRTAYLQRTETSISHASSGSSQEVKNNGKFLKLCPKRDRSRLRELCLYERFYLESFDLKRLCFPVGGCHLQELFPQAAQVYECCYLTVNNAPLYGYLGFKV